MEAGGLGPRGVRSGAPAGSGVVRCRRRPRPPGVRRSRPPSAAVARSVRARDGRSGHRRRRPRGRLRRRRWIRRGQVVVDVARHRPSRSVARPAVARDVDGDRRGAGNRRGLAFAGARHVHCATLARRTDRRRRRCPGVADPGRRRRGGRQSGGALPGRGRTDRPGGRPHPRGGQRSVDRQPRSTDRTAPGARGAPVAVRRTRGARRCEHDRLVRVGRHGVSGRAW